MQNLTSEKINLNPLCVKDFRKKTCENERGNSPVTCHKKVKLEKAGGGNQRLFPSGPYSCVLYH